MPDVPDVTLDGLYGQMVLDHYRNPRNRQALEAPDVEAEEFNPFCGDRVVYQLELDTEGRVTNSSARSEGCTIIQASASMMAQLSTGKTLLELQELSDQVRSMMQGKLSDHEAAEMGDLPALQAVRQYPVRIKCALLPWTALEVGVEEFISKRGA